MQVLRRKAVTFLKGIGFQDPHTWEDDKIVRYLQQAPQRLSIEQVPVRLRGFFRMLQADADIRLVKSRKAVTVDSYGFRQGTISSKVAAALSTEWKSEDAIAQEAGVIVEKARAVLYRMMTRGQLRRQVRIEYSLKPEPNTTGSEAV